MKSGEKNWCTKIFIQKEVAKFMMFHFSLPENAITGLLEK